jgi:cyanuric acid amidohydrolase
MTEDQIVEIDVVEMASPGDVSGLRELLAHRRAEDIVAIIGKTEGSGLGRDDGRATAETAIQDALAERLGSTAAEVAERVCIILSGGAPGVITPHIAVVSRRRSPRSGPRSPGGRLVVGLAISEPIQPWEVGRMAQVHRVSATVTRALLDAGVDAADVRAVLVKAPSITEAGIAAAADAGLDTVTRELGVGPTGAICFANDASALGVAIALGEVDAELVTERVIRSDFSLYSDVAFASSGGEKTRAEVLVLANGEGGVGPLRIGHSSMRDILDVAAVDRALDDAGGRDVAYALGKMIIPGSTTLRGHRITLQDDPVGYHVAKAMGGYLLAAATGSTTNFVSGGEHNSHQGPPDGNPVAVIVRAPR